MEVDFKSCSEFNLKEKSVFVEDHSCELLQKLNEQRSIGLFCDVEILVNGKIFPVHRNVLSSSSEYFNAMFCSNMLEQNSQKVELKQLNEVAVEEVLEYIYTGCIYLTEANITNILQTASIMLIKSLLKEIDFFLLESVCPENCLNFREISILFSLASLKKSVEECILSNFAIVSSQEKFNDLSVDDIKFYVDNDKNEVKYEEMLFDVIISWISKDPENRGKHFYELFSCLRLQLVSQRFLYETVRKEPMVKSDHRCRDIVEDVFHFHFKPYGFPLHYDRSFKRMYLLNYGPPGFVETLYFKESTETKKIRQPKMSVSLTSAIALHKNTVYFCGGYYEGTSYNVTKDIISFDGESWNLVAELKTGRAHALAVFIGDALYIFGGECSSNMILTTEKLKDGVCEEVDDIKLPCGRSSSGVVCYKDRLHFIGGFQNVVPRPRTLYDSIQYKKVHSDAISINLVDKKETLSNLREARASFGLATKESKIFVFGGIGNSSQRLLSAEFCDTTADGLVWTSLKQAPITLGLTSAAMFSNNQVVLAGKSGKLLAFDLSTLTWETEVQKYERRQKHSSKEKPGTCSLGSISPDCRIFCVN